MTRIIIISAVAKNKVIGNNGKIPWHIADDFARFRELTMGFPVIMGRKTFESLPEQFRPLPGRENIVLSRQPDFHAPGVVAKQSLAGAIDYCKQKNAQKAFVCGGQAVYAEALGCADMLEITRVDRVVDGDAFFPDINKRVWKKIREETHKGFSFITYARK